MKTAIGDDSQTANIRQSLVEDGQLTDASCMPLTPEEAKANPDKQYVLTGGFTLHACAVDAGINLNAKVHPRKEWSEVLKDAVTANFRRNGLGVMDISASIHRMLALGVSEVDIKKALAPANKTAMSDIRYRQHFDLWNCDETIKMMAASGQITADGALHLTNKTPATQQRQLKAVETTRLLAIRDEQIRDREWVDRIGDEALKAALLGTMPAMPEYTPKTRRRAKKADAPITAAELKATDKPKAEVGAEGPRTSEELAECFKKLKSRGGLMIEAAAILEGLRVRKLTEEEFCDGMVALITNGGDEAKHIRRQTAKKTGAKALVSVA
jgi:hypothetical protein